jgi:LysM repeat protein
VVALRLVEVSEASEHPARGRREAHKRRRRVFFWRRVAVVVAIAGTGAAVWAVGDRLVGVAGAQTTRPPVQHVYVARPGDTIWGIAVRFSGDGDPGPLAYELEAQIGGGVLQPGDQLRVP